MLKRNISKMCVGAFLVFMVGATFVSCSSRSTSDTGSADLTSSSDTTTSSDSQTPGAEITPQDVDNLTFTLNGTPIKLGDSVTSMFKLGYQLADMNVDNITNKQSYSVVFASQSGSQLRVLVTGTSSNFQPLTKGIICGIEADRDGGRDNDIEFSNGLATNIYLTTFNERYEKPDDKDITNDNSGNMTYTYNGTDVDRCSLALTFSDSGALDTIKYENRSANQ
jgi:hypothetical protein